MEKKIAWIALATLCVISSVVWALDPMGSPNPDLKAGEKSIGLEYAYTTEDLDVDNAGWSDNSNPTLELDPLHKVYAKLAWGISDDFEAFVRVGGAGMDHEFKNPEQGDQEGGTDWDLAWGAGIKTTLFESSETLKWGLLAQYGWLEVEGSDDSDWGEGDYKIKEETVQIAFGPTWQLSDTVELYGGVFWYEADGSLKMWHDTSNDTNPHPIETDENLGAYVGGQFLFGCTAVNIEYSSTGDADLIGINMVWKY